MLLKRKEAEEKPEKESKPKKEPKAKKAKKDAPPPEPQYYKSATGITTLNYKVYTMSLPEKLLYSVLAFAVGAFVGYLFYGGIGVDEDGAPTIVTYILNTIVMVGVGALAMRLFLPIRQEQLRVARQKKLKMQFRDMLEAISTSLSAGKNVQESFAGVYDDLKNQYEEGAFILEELEVINTGLANGFRIEEILADFGQRSGCEDIEDFAGVFEICYRKGGNIKDTIRSTYNILSDKMSMAEEIETIVTGSKSEQNLMLIMPVLLIAMIKFSSPDFAENFVTPSGLMATTVALVLFVASYFVSRIVLDIKI